MLERIAGEGRAQGAQGIQHTRLRLSPARSGIPEHVARNERGRRSAIDGRTTRRPGYCHGQRRRNRIEEVFGWSKTVSAGEKLRNLNWARNKLCSELPPPKTSPASLDLKRPPRTRIEQTRSPTPRPGPHPQRYRTGGHSRPL